MADTTGQIVVNTAPLPATYAAGLRYAIAVLGPVVVAKGWIDANSLPGITTLIGAAVTIIYGLWKTHSRQTNLNDAADGKPITKGQ